jgi:hypothetical protein
MRGRVTETLKKALADTLDFFGWSPRQLFVPALLLLVGWGFPSQWAPTPEAPLEEVMLWLTYTFAPFGTFAILLFAWNLVCAPYRLQKLENDALRVENQRLLARTPVVRMDLSHCSWGGHNTIGNPDEGIVFVILSIANTGDRPISFVRWQLKVEIAGVRYACAMTHHTGTITLGNPNGETFTYGSDEFIYENVAKTPVSSRIYERYS